MMVSTGRSGPCERTDRSNPMRIKKAAWTSRIPRRPGKEAYIQMCYDCCGAQVRTFDKKFDFSEFFAGNPHFPPPLLAPCREVRRNFWFSPPLCFNALH